MKLLFQNTRRLNPVKFILAFLLTIVMIFGSTQMAPVTSASSNTKIVVMLNLEDVTDFTAFDKQMATLKSKGVYGVEVDMWWNHFEPTKQGEYDWTYYKNLFTHIQKAGLKISPIFSFHQCGGNVGDTCNYPIPNWVWNLGTQEQMQFKSESGYYDKEYIAPWFDNKAVDLYDGAFISFAKEMTEFKSSFEKFHIGLGPAGELRYPSYNFADGWKYPARGLFQAYSGAAVADFQHKMQVKYTDIDALNSAWKTSFSSFSEVQPPKNGDLFYSSGDFEKPYGVDFLTWYQSTLENHFTSIITKAHADLDSYGVPLSAKVPGIHWQYSNPDAPHAAEQATGLYDYSKLLDLYKAKANNVDLTFTMLEMTNEANGNGDAPNYSQPQTLIDEVSQLAVSKGIEMEGENALPVGNAEGFKTIYNVVNKYNYGIFTLLRLQNVVQANGEPTNLLDPFVTTLKLGELPQQRVTINIYDPQKDPDAKVSIVGNSGAIGNWDPTAGAPMKYLGDGHWQVNLTLTATGTYEFKANRVDANNPEWGADPNFTWTVPYIPGGTAVFKADLQRVGQDEQHKHYITGDVALNGAPLEDTTVSLTDANGSVTTAVYGEEKQSDNGSYGLIANADDVSKAHYYFEVPRGSYTLKAVNGNHSAQMTVVANSQTLSDENLLIDNVPDLQLGDAFTVTKKSFSTEGGVSASVNVAPTPLGTDITNKVVIFMLMDGDKPVGINAVGTSGSAAQDVSTFFNVAGGNYKLNVFVVDAYDINSTTNIGNVLAEPLVLQNN